MTDQQEDDKVNESAGDQPSKRLDLTRLILKWIGLILLAFVLILALVFQAPWKVTGLLIIVLLAFTVIPESHLKWFLLSFIAVLIALIIWVFLPDGNDLWLPYTFDEEIADHEAKFTIPDEENAAVIYNQLLQDYDHSQWRISFMRREEFYQTSSEPWLSRDHPKLVQWIGKHEKALMALPEVCRMKTCRFPSNFEISPTNKLQTNRYFALKSWALILLFSGNNDTAKGDLNDAFSKYIYALQIKEHLYQQKRINDLLIGFGIEDLALRPLNRFVIENGLNEKQLQLVLDVLGNLENNWSSDFSQCLEYEKLFIKNAFGSLVYQTNTKGVVRFSRDPAAAIWGHRRRRALAETYWEKKSMKTYTILGWFFFPANPQKAAEMIDSIFEQHSPMASPDFDWHEENIGPSPIPALKLNCHSLVDFLTNKSTRLYGRFHDVYLKRLAQRRALRLLIAIKQYNVENGCWPKDLDAINSFVPPEAFIDPVNNSSFVYKPGDDSFVFYSKGKNNIDEDGKRDRWDEEKTGADDWLIWPSRSRKTKDQETDV